MHPTATTPSYLPFYTPFLPTSHHLTGRKRALFVRAMATKDRKRKHKAQLSEDSTNEGLSRILRTEAALLGIGRKAAAAMANAKSKRRLSPRAVLEALDEAIANGRWDSALELVMQNFNLNKEYIDLNSTPADYDAGHLPVLSSENIRISTEEHNDGQPTGGPTLIEISGEPFFPSMPGETSGPSPKRRSYKRLQDLPDGWTVQEHVRLSGKSAGKTYKFFIEPGTRKKFRSMPEVRHHLGMADP
ncbi:LOW protein: PPR containing protein isoform X2 [Carex rostrata]